MEPDRLLFEDSTETKRAAEINNALAVILGNAQLLLLRNTVAPEDRAKLKAIEQSSFRLQGLVEGMMQSNRARSF
jgi:nitrogen-specific signal transduction histidine kinase